MCATMANKYDRNKDKMVLSVLVCFNAKLRSMPLISKFKILSKCIKKKYFKTDLLLYSTPQKLPTVENRANTELN